MWFSSHERQRAPCAGECEVVARVSDEPEQTGPQEARVVVLIRGRRPAQLARPRPEHLYDEPREVGSQLIGDHVADTVDDARHRGDHVAAVITGVALHETEGERHIDRAGPDERVHIVDDADAFG